MKFLLLLVLFATSSVLAQNETTTVPEETTTPKLEETTTPKLEEPTTVTPDRETTRAETTHMDGPTTPVPEATTQAHEATNSTEATTEHVSMTTEVEKTSTPAPIQTTTPVTPPHSQPSYESAHKWEVTNGTNGTICLIVDISIQLRVKYNQTNNETVTAYINVPTDANQTEMSACGEHYDSLGLTWNNSYNLELVFTNNLTDKKYGLYSVLFRYMINPIDFPSAREEGESKTADHVLTSGESFLVGHVGKSYKCDSNEKVSLNDDVEFYFQSAQVQAFTNSEKFGTVEECPADDKTDDIVPIAVGCALAGLVIIVLIAYMVGRRRSRQKGYQSV